MFSIVNNYIQRKLQRENLEEVPATDAAKWLAEANILKDSVSSPGFPLRRNIHKGNIFGAYKKSNNFWYIRRIHKYEEIICINELRHFFSINSRTGIYQKIKLVKVPMRKLESGRIYFSVKELMRWSIEKKKPDLLRKLELYLSQIDNTGEL